MGDPTRGETGIKVEAEELGPCESGMCVSLGMSSFGGGGRVQPGQGETRLICMGGSDAFGERTDVTLGSVGGARVCW